MPPPTCCWRTSTGATCHASRPALDAALPTQRTQRHERHSIHARAGRRTRLPPTLPTSSSKRDTTTSPRTSCTSASDPCSTASASPSPAPRRRWAAIIRRYLDEQGIDGTDGSTVIGASERLPARFAAFANGVSIHADDYDDTQLAVAKDRVYGLLMHPTAPALPPALALAERDGRSGRDMMLAYQVGVEVACKVAEAILPRHYQQGFHSTATCGAIGAAAAAAKLLGLDRDDVRRALSLGASQAGGLRENFGTMTKPFHAGRAAESGRRRGRACAARVHRVADRPRSGPRVLPRGGRRLQRGHDRRTARQAVDVRVTRRVDQAAPERLADPPGHERDAGPHPAARSSAGAGAPRVGGHEPQHAERAHPPSAAQRTAGEVQHGVLHGDPAARAQGGPRAIHRRRRQPARCAGDDREGRLRRAPGGGGRRASTR